MAGTKFFTRDAIAFDDGGIATLKSAAVIEGKTDPLGDVHDKASNSDADLTSIAYGTAGARSGVKSELVLDENEDAIMTVEGNLMRNVLASDGNSTIVDATNKQILASDGAVLIDNENKTVGEGTVDMDAPTITRTGFIGGIFSTGAHTRLSQATVALDTTVNVDSTEGFPDVCTTTLASNTTSLDDHIHLTDASTFPSRGIILVDGYDYVKYTGKSGNILTGITTDANDSYRIGSHTTGVSVTTAFAIIVSDLFTYTGKTLNTFTGCSGVGTHSKREIVCTGTHLVLDTENDELLALDSTGNTEFSIGYSSSNARMNLYRQGHIYSSMTYSYLHTRANPFFDCKITQSGVNSNSGPIYFNRTSVDFYRIAYNDTVVTNVSAIVTQYDDTDYNAVIAQYCKGTAPNCSKDRYAYALVCNGHQSHYGGNVLISSETLSEYVNSEVPYGMQRGDKRLHVKDTAAIQLRLEGGSSSIIDFNSSAGTLILSMSATNGALLSDTNITDDLGSSSYRWRQLFLRNADLQYAGTAKTTTDLLVLTNSGNAADMDGTGAGILFNQYYYDASTPAIADAGRIAVLTETDWTSTASTQDSAMSFQTALDGTVAEKIRITSGGRLGIGTVTPASILDVTDGLTTVGAVLTLGTKETTVVANDILGRINFYAPLEASGTDAVLPGASIAAEAEAEFTSSVNATSLLFQTGASETATTKMAIKSDGKVGVGTTAPKSMLQVNGGVQCGNDSDAASADKAGTFRYRVDGSKSYCEVCMRTDVATYVWYVIKEYDWGI